MIKGKPLRGKKLSLDGIAPEHRQNNFDFIRLMAACFVLFSHMYPPLRQAGTLADWGSFAGRHWSSYLLFHQRLFGHLELAKRS
jgi:hypothetical protein